jgi:primosomal protein N' (replication factor Y)
MIAKGLDFPNVTLVGVIHADQGLVFPDVRSAEQTFQLLAQVAGRTGRGPHGGRVLIQTFLPEHPVIQAALDHDYVGFAARTLALREAMGDPPFGRLARVVVRGAVEADVARHAADLGAAVAAADPSIEVRGPAPCPLPMARGLYRHHLVLRHDDAPPLRAALWDVVRPHRPPRDVEVLIDVDPVRML